MLAKRQDDMQNMNLQLGSLLIGHIITISEIKERLSRKAKEHEKNSQPKEKNHLFHGTHILPMLQIMSQCVVNSTHLKLTNSSLQESNLVKWGGTIAIINQSLLKLMQICGGGGGNKILCVVVNCDT